MKIVEILKRRKGLSELKFDCEVNPSDLSGEKGPTGLLAIDTETLFLERIKVGREVTEQELTNLIEKSFTNRAISRALYILSFSACSSLTLKQKLLRSFPLYAVESAVARMVETKLVDDGLFAVRQAEVLEKRFVSKRQAEFALKQKGISGDELSLAMEQTSFDDYSSAVALIEKNYKAKMQDKNSINKVFAALMRKGFNYTDVKKAIEHFNTEIEFTEE